jgi:hypothetical protein
VSKQGDDKIKPPEIGQVTKEWKTKLPNRVSEFVSRPIAMWKKTVVAWDRILPQHSPGGTEGHHGEPQ